MRFDYLTPAQGPVVDGLEDHERIFALRQAEYLPIRTLPGEKGVSAIYRCGLSQEQRQMIADGADVLVEIFHFGFPLAPSRVMLLNQSGLGREGEVEAAVETKEALASWFRVQTKGPYEVRELNG
jgi:hypothetical protein